MYSRSHAAIEDKRSLLHLCAGEKVRQRVQEATTARGGDRARGVFVSSADTFACLFAFLLDRAFTTVQSCFAISRDNSELNAAVGCDTCFCCVNINMSNLVNGT